MKNLFCLILFAFLASCKIGDDEVSRDTFFFSEQVSLTNVKETYQPGDFVLMRYILPGKVMTDTETGMNIQVGNAGMQGVIDVYDPFVDNPEEEKFSFSLNDGFVTETGDFSKDGVLEYVIGCPNDTEYSMDIGLTFQKKGGYLVYLNRENPTYEFAFTESGNCGDIDFFNLPDDADFAFVQFFFGVDNVNRDKFNEYAALFPDSTVDTVALGKALDEKRAFFVWVK